MSREHTLALNFTDARKHKIMQVARRLKRIKNTTMSFNVSYKSILFVIKVFPRATAEVSKRNETNDVPQHTMMIDVST